MTSPKIHLLLIDPQNDFCDLPPSFCPQSSAGPACKPSLPVTGAHADMLRVARLIEQYEDQLSDISITLDSHHRFDIGHPAFWQQADGHDVSPFTLIIAADVRAGRFIPRNLHAQSRVLDYLVALEQAGRYTHMVWPVHGEIGTWGHNIHIAVQQACSHWEMHRQRVVNMVFKGMNPWTEHYSAIMAEVPDKEDENTGLNRALLEKLAEADKIVIAGEASSHCVRSTTEHIVEHIGAQHLGKLVLLTDCMSPVGSFETQHSAFIENMQEKGVATLSSADMVTIFQ